MASDLIPSSIVAPGFYGLNTQDAPSSLPKEFCLVAYNAVIDNFGRLAARKGWEAINAASNDLGSEIVGAVHEYVTTAGATELLVVGNNHIFTLDGTTLTSIYSDNNWLSNNWKIVNFNDKAYFFQRGHTPLVYDGSTLIKITSHGSYSGTIQEANEVLSAYGRLWTADTTTDKKTVKWSDSLIGEAWTGGASGTLSMESVLTNGTTPVVALAAFNGYLVNFCENSIVIYDGADDDPSTNLALLDVIDGIGCIARDSVVDVGSDIFFLSNTGVRSLGRVIDQKSMPLNDVSANVRDSLITDVEANNNNGSGLKAAYNPIDGFYIISLVELGRSYVFDLKKRLEDNVCRITSWGLAPNSFCNRRNNDFIMGFAGSVGRYSGYNDNGNGYRFVYRSSYWTHDDAAVFKILKQARLLVFGGAGETVAFRWSIDFDGIERGVLATLDTTGTVSEYNIAEYGIGTYVNHDDRLQTVKVALGGAGRVYQMELETIIGTNPFSIQEIDVFAKIGRMHNL